MTFKDLACLGALALAVSPALAQADDDAMNSGQEAGTVSSDTSMNPNTTTNGSDTKKADAGDAAKMKVGPHAVTVRTALESAKVQVQGLRNQLEITKDAQPQDPMYMKQWRMHSKEIGADIRQASEHETMLRSSVQAFPEIAKSDEFKGFDTAVNDLRSANKDWESRSNQASYWKNYTQASNDLKKLQDRIDAALDKAEDFTSSELKFSKVS